MTKSFYKMIIQPNKVSRYDLKLGKGNVVSTTSAVEKERKESYFKPVINFMYFFLLSPFTVESVNGVYVLKSNLFHKVASIITHIGTLGISVSLMLHLDFSTGHHSNITQLLQTIGYVSSIIAVCLFNKSLWYDQHHILEFLNASRMAPVPHKLIYLGSIFLFMVQSLVSYLNGIVHTCAGEMTKWCLSWICSSKDDPICILSGNLIYYLFFFLCCLGVPNFAMGRYVVMLMAVQFRNLGKQFQSSLKCSQNVETVANKYENLKRTVELGNQWIGPMLTFYYVCILTFLATLPDALKDTETPGATRYPEEVMERWHAVFTCATQGAFLLVACDFPERVRDSCKDWIAKKLFSGSVEQGLSQEDRLGLIGLGQRIEGKPVGLSCAFFTLTYSFLGSMLGLVATYGVLVFQVNK